MYHLVKYEVLHIYLMILDGFVSVEPIGTHRWDARAIPVCYFVVIDCIHVHVMVDIDGDIVISPVGAVCEQGQLFG